LQNFGGIQGTEIEKLGVLDFGVFRCQYGCASQNMEGKHFISCNCL